MITAQQLTLVGKVEKTHGTGGELSMSFFDSLWCDRIEPDTCIIMDMEGIYTPFFVSSVRPRGSESLLVMIDGVRTKEDAAAFVGKDVFVNKDDDYDDQDDDEGFYAGQLIGYQAIDETAGAIGEIIDIEDRTDNALFIVRSSDGKEIFIPIADDLITDIDTDNNKISFDLPEGLLTL